MGVGWGSPSIQNCVIICVFFRSAFYSSDIKQYFEWNSLANNCKRVWGIQLLRKRGEPNRVSIPPIILFAVLPELNNEDTCFVLPYIKNLGQIYLNFFATMSSTVNIKLSNCIKLYIGLVNETHGL